MTLEELQEFMKDEKNAAAFGELVKAAGYVSEADTTALKQNSDKILSEKRKLKAEYEAMKKRLDDIDIEEYNELKAKQSASPEGSDELRALKREIEKRDKERAQLEARLNQTESELNNTTITNDLNRYFNDNKVAPEHRSILETAFRNQAKVEVYDDKRSTIINDKPADEYFKEFFGSDSGKLYVSKPVNSGAGAPNLSNTGSKTSFKRSEISANESVRKQYSAAVKAGTATLID